MSAHLLFDPEAESFGSPIELTRSHAVTATLGRILCGKTSFLYEPIHISVNDCHSMWQSYASELGMKTKLEVPELLNPGNKVKHPSFTAPKWLTAFTLKILNEETTARSSMYSSAIGYDFSDVFALSDMDKLSVAKRMDQAWAECEVIDESHTTIVLGQIASSYVFNATLRQHVQEERILSTELTLAS